MSDYKKRKGQHILLAVVLIGSFIWSLSILPPHDELIHSGGLILIKIHKYMSGSNDSDICLCIGIYGAFDYHWTYIWTVVFENFIFRKNR